jgi:hypothetical protein
MNFGKHGRAVLLGGLLVSTSTLVFGGLLGGIATAAPGTIKVGGIPAEQGGNGNDPHVNTACIGIREFGFVPGVQTTATFTTVAPTRAGSSLTVTADSATLVSYDLKTWLGSLGTAPKQGYHVSIDVNGKKKVFWIADPTKGCSSPVDPCVANANLFGDSLTAGLATLEPGSGIGILYKGTETIDASQVEFKLDGVVTGPVYPARNTDGTTNIWYITDNAVAGGGHTASVKLSLPNGVCAQQTWSFTVLASGGAT